jgi:FkbM family methyltransferase
MSITSYAQNFEDVLLWRVLGHIQNGRYLDIGAQDPRQDSVSRAFYEAGWRGVHVEPTPTYASLLRANRPDEQVIEAAVSEQRGLMKLYEFPETGLSTGIDEIALQHRDAGRIANELLVPTVTLHSLFNLFEGDIHWLKIDVEGMEAEALRSWGEHPQRPWVLVIEATLPNTDTPSHDAWIHMVVGKGYEEVFFDGLSRYFVSLATSALNIEPWITANIFDHYAVTKQHFTARHWRSEAEASEQRTQELDVRLRAASEQLRTLRASEQSLKEDLASSARKNQQAEVSLRFEMQQREDALISTQQSLRSALQATLREQEVLKERHAEEMAHVGSQFKELQAFIHDVLAKPTSLWQRLGRALRLAPEDYARTALASRRLPIGLTNLNSEESSMSASPTATEANTPKVLSSLADLLALEGADFVRNAYVSILGRKADPQGEAYYVERLSRGHHKLEILLQLSKSREAKLFLYPPEGLTEAFRSFRRQAAVRGSRQAAASVERRVLLQAKTPDVSKFMAYHDEDFVRILFSYFLGRKPDPSGCEFYLGRIRSGVSRQTILLEVARSAEAKTNTRVLRGEKRLAVSLLLYRTPILGTLIAAVRFGVGIKNYLANMRALQNQLYRASKKIETL